MRCWSMGGVLAGLSLVAPAHAQEVSLQFELDRERVEQLGLSADDLEPVLSGSMDQALNLGQIQDFMNSMANAAAIASKGMGVDYTGSYKRVITGFSLGSGAHGTGVTLARTGEVLPPSGFAAQMSGMVGINLGGLAGADEKSFSRRISLYANGLAMPMPTASPVGGFMYNAGLHAQLRIINPLGSTVSEWSGLFLTSGFQRSSYTLSLRRDMPLQTDLEGVEVGWTGSGDYRLSAINDGIPLELSTSFRIAVVHVYAGGAVDFNTGTSEASASMGGPVYAELNGESQRLGSASLSMKANGVADDMVPRFFAGAQINVAVLRAYAHVNVGMNDAIGGHVGARLGF